LFNTSKLESEGRVGMIVRQQLDNKYRIDIVISDQVCEILLFHHDRGEEERRKSKSLPY